MLTSISRSLRDLTGDSYADAAVRAAHALTGTPLATLAALVDEPVEFFDPAFARRNAELTRLAGTRLVDGFDDGCEGAPTDAFRRAQHTAAAPLGGLGVCRIGQDGRVYLAAKSEHYQLALGHSFPGYRLIDRARSLGVLNATHNNTRGHLTRLAERALVAAANGVEPADLDDVLAADEPRTLSRVVNLETGSLAAEAALKVMLSRFYGVDADTGDPDAPTPVFLVLGDFGGGLGANYHGTTILAQSLRGLWPRFAERAGAAGLFRVVGVPIGDLDGFREAFERHNSGNERVAGFCHEIILMNYGGLRLEESYLRGVYELCHANDVPVLADEIQSGAWCGELFLFRRYGLRPDLVAIGKGFPGGEYPASRLLLTREADRLSQFGALVTNGQEELASLAYLVTMAFVRANAEHIESIGRLYQARLGDLRDRFPRLLAAITGDGHLAGLQFREPGDAQEFCRLLESEHGIDTSTQAYKPSAPPTALTKLPLISDETTVEVVIERMASVLSRLEAGHLADGATSTH